MYDVNREHDNKHFNEKIANEKALYDKRKALSDLRTKQYKEGIFLRGGGIEDPLPEDAVSFLKDYYDYYKTKRGYHDRSLNSNVNLKTTCHVSYIRLLLLRCVNDIRSAILIILGDKAHSAYFSKNAYEHLIKDSDYTSNKELLMLKNVVHTDLYDGGTNNLIP